MKTNIEYGDLGDPCIMIDQETPKGLMAMCLSVNREDFPSATITSPGSSVEATLTADGGRTRWEREPLAPFRDALRKATEIGAPRGAEAGQWAISKSSIDGMIVILSRAEKNGAAFTLVLEESEARSIMDTFDDWDREFGK